MKVEEGVLLSRFTTVGIGGPARAFAKPETIAELEEALAWASERELPVATIGLGSNLLVADEGFDGLVLKLAGELATAEVDGERLVAGGGAANAVCLHRARAARLGGFEFACAIPGTVGGGVRMNAGAYGSDWAAILERALVVDSEGSRWLDPTALGLTYRHSRLRHGQVVAVSEFRLDPRPEDEIKAKVAEAAGSERPHSPPTSAPSQRLPEPAARADGGADARGVRAEGPPDRRRADLAAPRELHRERRRRVFDRRDRADGGGAPTCARAVRGRAPARGGIPRPARTAVGAARPVANLSPWPSDGPSRLRARAA